MTIQSPERSETSLQVSYVEYATDITISGTTEAAANLIVTATSITANGSDAYWVEFFCPAAQTAASTGAQVRVALYDNAAPIVAGLSTFGIVATPAANVVISPFTCRRRVVPSAGAHVYDVRAWRVTANGVINGSVSGISTPGYISVTRAS